MEKIKGHERVIHQNNIVSATQDRSLLREQGREKRKKKKELTQQQRDTEFAREKDKVLLPIL